MPKVRNRRNKLPCSNGCNGSSGKPGGRKWCGDNDWKGRFAERSHLLGLERADTAAQGDCPFLAVSFSGWFTFKWQYLELPVVRNDRSKLKRNQFIC